MLCFLLPCVPQKEKGEALRRASPTCSDDGLKGPSRVSGQAGFGLLGEGGEAGLVEHGDVGQHLAVQVDVRLLEAVHEAAVRETAEAGRRVDAGDPQAPHVALLVATVAVGVL